MVIGLHLDQARCTRSIRGGFLCRARRYSSAWTPGAIELNLPKGGTTHPFLTLQFLTDWNIRRRRRGLSDPWRQPQYLVDRLKGLTVTDLFDSAVNRNLLFDQSRCTCVVFDVQLSNPNADASV